MLTHKQLVDKTVTYSNCCRKSQLELRVGTWRLKLEKNPWKSAMDRLASHGFLGLLSYATQDH